MKPKLTTTELARVFDLDPDLLEATAEYIDVPAEEWQRRRRAALAARRWRGQTGSVNDTMPAEDVRPRRKRQQPSAVHDVLDELGWTIGMLTRAINMELPRMRCGLERVSRPSVQFWAVGERKVKLAGKKRSTPHAVQAPWEVRTAAYAVTRRYAVALGIGDRGVLRPDAWPNVEDS